VLVVSGESPLKYFEVVPVRHPQAGAVMLGRFSTSADYTLRVPFPAAALNNRAVRTIETAGHSPGRANAQR